MRKTIISSILLLMAIVALAIKYFNEISVKNNNLEKVIELIPEDAAIVLSFNNDESFYEILSEYELFDAIIGKARAADIELLQTFLLQQPQLAEATSDRKVFISLHPNKADSVDFLFSINLNEKFSKNEIEEQLKQLRGIETRALKENIYEVKISGGSKPFFMSLQNGLAIGSYNVDLLSKSIDKQSEKLDKEFIEEINHASNKVQSSPVNFFINHNKLGSFTARFLKGKPGTNLALLNNLRGISSLNLNYKSDALMLNGISSIDTTAENYLQLFLSQKPVKNDIKKVIPENTANFLVFGLSDYISFHQQLQRRLADRKVLNNLNKEIQTIQSETGVSPERDLKPAFGNEFCIIEKPNREKLAIIKVLNGRKINFSLDLMSNTFGGGIGQFNYPNILYYYFGDPFKYFPRPFYAVVDNFLVVSNSPSTIQTYLQDYKNRKFLAGTRDFSEYNQLVATQSNILYFVNNKNSDKIVSSALRPPYAKAFTDSNFGLKNFYGLSYQWTAEGDHFFTNIYLNYKSSGNRTVDTLWKVQLNARPAGEVQVVQNGDEKLILVQDKANNLYGITPEGRRLWGTQLSGAVVGEVNQLTDQTILVCTSNKLYRFSPGGSLVSGFPVSIPFFISDGLTITDRKPEKAKIFLTAGNVILGYDSQGKSLPNWRKEVGSRILSNIECVRVNHVTYLVAGTEEGLFHLYKEDGSEALKVDATKYGPFRNQIAQEKGEDLASSRLVTTNRKGEVISIFLDGKITKKGFGDWSPEHSFYYRNVTGDEARELVYLDKNQLSVFNNEGELIYSYELNSPKNELQFFNVDRFTFQIGISSGKQIYLFNETGTLVKGFPINGKGSFYTGSIKNNGINYFLNGGSDNFLYAYKL